MRRTFFLSAILFVLFISLGCGTPSHNPTAGNGTFKVDSFSPPSITTLTPNSAPVNSVPFTIEVDGANFTTDALVFWNGKPIFTRFVNSQQLFADLKSTDLMFSGMIEVYVRASALNSNTVEFDLH